MPAEPLTDLLRSILEKRGLTTDDAIAQFLAPDYVRDTHAPELLADITAATARIFAALERGERITIYADFDCDGIPGAAVLADFFKKIQYQHVDVYLPHRDKEGYGLHREALDELKKRGTTLIITVDVGTTAVESIAHATRLGIDTIVTDHHEIPGELPAAVAVINPKRAPYPFPHLCGAAVAFKLVQALLHEGRARGDGNFLAVPEGWEKWLLDLVAIATVADMVPLVGENRALVYWGLTVLRKSSRPGMSALCRKLRIQKRALTEDDISFSIAPRINAASRMGTPDLALALLTTSDQAEAERLANELESLNASRKGVVAGIVKEARRRAKERFSESATVVVLGDPEWKPALLGLAANSILGDRSGVVCLWGRDANGRIKGSCRSDGSLSVVELFSAASDVFEEFGGHVASGGFSLAPDAVHTFPERLAAAAEALPRTSAPETFAYEADVILSRLDGTLYRQLARLAPFGIGNPKPVFRARTTIRAVKRFGKEKNHVELSVVCPASGERLRAYDFFRTETDFSAPVAPGASAAILATLERDTYRGGFALRLVDVTAV